VAWRWRNNGSTQYRQLSLRHVAAYGVWRGGISMAMKAYSAPALSVGIMA